MNDSDEFLIVRCDSCGGATTTVAHMEVIYCDECTEELEYMFSRISIDLPAPSLVEVYCFATFN